MGGTMQPITSRGVVSRLINRLVRLLVQSGYTITDRQYLGFEPESGYHHYTVDVAQYYEYETEER